jgi:glutathione reductase (NADPH)
MTQHKVDLFVIGGGSGGVRAARIAAGHGAKVMLAEEFRMGGTCVIRGCVPKKLYVYASRYAHAFEDSRGFGWSPGKARFDWSKLVSAKEQEITRLEGLYTKGQSNAGVEVVKSRAVIDGPGRVRLLSDGRVIEAGRILIATGGRPVIPRDIPGHNLAISSNEVFDLKTFPKRIVIVGGGYIAVEFAGIFKGLGSEVTLVHRGPSLLRGFDGEMAKGVMAAYEKRGIALKLGTTVSRIEKAGRARKVALSSGETLTADQVMFATGRQPNVEGLGLDTLGLKLAANGAIPVNDHSETAAKGVFAVGDVTDRVQLTPVAIREGHAFADTQFGKKPWAVKYANIATAVFSTPELGTIGMTEEQAKANFDAVDIFRSQFRTMKTVLAGGDEKTVMKILVDPKTDLVLGVHILGDDAGEIIQMVGVAMQMKARKADFDATMALHPSAAEELVTMRTPSERWRKAG